MVKIKKKDDPSGLVFVGCLFVGMGLGFLYDNIVVGLFLGMGVGFFGLFVAQAILKKK